MIRYDLEFELPYELRGLTSDGVLSTAELEDSVQMEIEHAASCIPVKKFSTLFWKHTREMSPVGSLYRVGHTVTVIFYTDVPQHATALQFAIILKERMGLKTVEVIATGAQYLGLGDDTAPRINLPVRSDEYTREQFYRDMEE